MKKVRRFGKAIWKITGKGNDVDIIFEHPVETPFPVSSFVVKRGGMGVFCAGTSGYNLTMDARLVWMRQKRIQGSHFANPSEVWEAHRLVVEQRINPCLSEVFTCADISRAHAKMQSSTGLEAWRFSSRRARHGQQIKEVSTGIGRDDKT